MSPRWLTIEKLVTELGGVCSARTEIKDHLDPEPPDVEPLLREATRAVTAAVKSPAPATGDPSHEDEVVRRAWTAIAVAQDRVAQLTREVARSREVRQRAQDLQDRALRLRTRPRSD